MTLPFPLTDVKAVIWDLDETLWAGVLSEGPVQRSTRREKLVWALARAGIVQSVASHNDRVPSESALRDCGVWDLFVFPQFSWGSKVAMVDEVVRLTQLRPTHVLFVDDNARIRAEVGSACSVATATPEEIDGIDAATLPVSDPSLARLAYYKIIEARHRARQFADVGSAKEFLRRCGIRVSRHDARAWKERILELAHRAHQLKFTQRPLNEAEFDRLAADPNVEFRAVSASDVFGSYGIAGFYALAESPRSLIHFVFSCRLLNMGVEQFLYQALGRPALDSGEPDKVAKLTGAAAVDWIAEDGGADIPTAAPAPETDAVKVLFIGGCDLETMSTYISTDRRIDATWHLPDTVDGVPCYAHSSLLALDAVRTGYGAYLDAVPWLRNWRPPAPLDAFDVIVLSLWVDYQTPGFRPRGAGPRIPGSPQADPDAPVDLPDYEKADRLTSEEIAELVVSFRQSLPETCRLVVLNGAELQPDARGMNAPDQHERNRSINKEVDRLAGIGVVDLGDVRKVVPDRTHLADDGLFTHYSRPAYARLAALVRTAVHGG